MSTTHRARLNAHRAKIIQAKIACGEKPSAFEIMCERLGQPCSIAPLTREIGPAIDEGIMPVEILARPCLEFGFERVWETYREWQPDETKARPHWPWIAFIASDYKRERIEKREYDNEPTPAKIKSLLSRVAANAKKLSDDMALLQKLADRLDDTRSPQRRGHLRRLNAYLSQSLIFAAGVNLDAEVMMIAKFERDHFHLQLAHLEAAAEVAAKTFSAGLLEQQPGGPRDHGLGHLVCRAARIWESLTGRPASVHKVRPRKRSHRIHANDDRPNFVLFVGNIAKMAVGQEPTFEQITSAFGPCNYRRK